MPAGVCFYVVNLGNSWSSTVRSSVTGSSETGVSQHTKLSVQSSLVLHGTETLMDGMTLTITTRHPQFSTRQSRTLSENKLHTDTRRLQRWVKVFE